MFNRALPEDLTGGLFFIQPTQPDPQQHVLSKMLKKPVVLPIRHDRPVLLPETNRGQSKPIYVDFMPR